MDVLLCCFFCMCSGVVLFCSSDLVIDIVVVVLDLDLLYLVVYGFLGIGKMYIVVWVIVELVIEYVWCIGVVVQLYVMVENLLEGVISVGLDLGQVVKKLYDYIVGCWQLIDGSQYIEFICDIVGCVIGGMVWDFVNGNWVLKVSLDLLVIDQVGQFCLVNIIVVVFVVINLLLFGDLQ